MKKIFLQCILVCLGLFTQANLNAQTLRHSYTFEDGTFDVSTNTVNDQVGTLNGTIQGIGLIFENGSVKNTYGSRGNNGYISFDGAALALNTYSALTLEFYLTTCNNGTANQWAVLSYFGGDAGANSFVTNVIMGNGAYSRAILNNSQSAQGTRLASNTTHHCVAVLIPSTSTTDGAINWYIDGTLAATRALTANTYNNAISQLATKNAFLFRSGWNDNNWTGTIHDFKIYDGAMDATTVAARNLTYQGNQLSAITVSSGVLKPTFASGVYEYALTIPEGTANLFVNADSSQTGKKIKGIGTYDVSGTAGTITVGIDTTADAMPYTIYWTKPISTPELIHSYTFADNIAIDDVNGANGTLVGTANKIANGAYIATANGNLTNGTSSHIVLPAKKIALSQYPSFTMETYVLAKANNFISYFGGQHYWGVDYIFMQHNATDISCDSYGNPWSGATSVSANAPGSNIDGSGHHMVTVVANDTMYTYRDGVFSAKKVLGATNKYFGIGNDTAYLGRSGYTGDASMIGTIGEYNIYKGAVDTAVIRSRSTAYHNADAFLTSMTISIGTLKPAFNTVDTSFTAVLPVGTTSVKLGALPSNTLATIADTGTVNVSSGTATRKVIVTAVDGVSKTYRTVNFRYVSTDSTLYDLTVNGTTVDGFVSNVYSYDVALPAGTTIVPTVIGTASFASATVAVTSATVIPGSTTILVTAENGTSKTTYTINFTYIDPTLVTDKNGLYFDDLNAKDSIIVSGANLIADITITAPVGITVNPAIIPMASATNIKVIINYDGTSAVNDSIVITSETLVKKVGVKAASNASCFTPLYPTGNLIADPTFNSLATYGGWGNKVVNTDPSLSYCGKNCGKIAGTDICWPNGGSIDANLTLKPNTKYIVRAMVKTMDGSFELSIGKSNGSAPDINNLFDTNGEWQSFSFEFTSGSVVTGAGCYFNNCNGSTGKVGYIDNLEVYEMPNIEVSPAALTFLGASTKKSAITGIHLSNDISIIAPIGFTVTPSTLLYTVAGDSISVTFNGLAPASGYIYLTSGAVKDSIQVTGTPATGIAIAKNSDLVSVKPTISNGNFKVEFANKLGTISVYDMKGKVISVKKAVNTTEIITVPAEGVYLIKITIGSAVKNVKVVRIR